MKSHLIVVFLIAAGLRCGWVLAHTEWDAGVEALEFADERDYWRMAEHLCEGRTMRDEMGFAAARMPGYPMFLSLCMCTPWPIPVARLAQALLAGGGCVLFTLIGKRVAGRTAGFLAGLLTAIDPFSVLFGNLLLSEVWLTVSLGLFVLIGLALMSSDGDQSEAKTRARQVVPPFWKWTAWALAFLACVYLHPSTVWLMPVWCLWMVYRNRTWGGAGGCVTAMLIVAAGIAPWSLRNQRVLGGTCLLTSRLGISLYDGVGPQATGRSDLAYTRDIPAVQGLDELSWDRWFRQRSIEAMRRAPGRIAGLAWRKLLLTWNVVPNVEAHRTPARMAVSAAWMVPILLLAAAGLFALPAGADGKASLLLPVVYFTLLHMVFVGSVRYRVPVMPYVEILAAGGLVAILRRLRPNLIAHFGL